MRYLRKLNNVNPAAGKYLSISIPVELTDIFKTDTAIIELLPDGKGIAVKPARVEAIQNSRWTNNLKQIRPARWMRAGTK